jgi:hypothetical protein
MTGMTQLGMGRALAMFSGLDRSDKERRAAAGAAAPARHRAILVIREWDWADQRPTSTTKCRPTGATRRGIERPHLTARSS